MAINIEGSVEKIAATSKLLTEYVEYNEDIKSIKDVKKRFNEIDFNRYIKVAKGAYKRHNVVVDDDIVPMRLLSAPEEEMLWHQTLVEFKDFPEFVGGENHPVFQSKLLRKKLSLATSPCPEVTEDKFRYYTEKQINHFPYVKLSFLSHHYDQINKLYNNLFSDKFEEEIIYILHALFEGDGMDEKKWALLNGSSSVQLSMIIVRLYLAIIKLADNATYTTWQDDLKQSVLDVKTPKTKTEVVDSIT